MITDERFGKIQKLELEWWTNYDYTPEGEWSHYVAVFAPYLSLFYDSVVDVGSGPIPFFCSGAFVYGHAVAVDPLIFHYSRIEKYSHYLAECLYECAVSTHILDDEAFEVVFALNVVDHTQDPESLLRELGRICRAGGRLFLFVDVDKKPDHMHPHQLDADWLLSILDESFDRVLALREKSWKFENDALWYVGKRKDDAMESGE